MSFLYSHHRMCLLYKFLRVSNDKHPEIVKNEFFPRIINLTRPDVHTYTVCFMYEQLRGLSCEKIVAEYSNFLFFVPILFFAMYHHVYWLLFRRHKKQQTFKHTENGQKLLEGIPNAINNLN